MSSSLLLELATLSSIGLVGLGFSSLLILRLHEADEKLRRRITAVTLPYLPVAKASTVHLFRSVGTSRATALARRAGSLIGYDSGRREQYLLPWWAVLATALALGRSAAGILAGLLGPFAMAAAPVLAIIVCRSFFGWCSTRRSRSLFRQMPDALAMIVRSVRVGIPMTKAIRAVGREAPQPTAGEFTLLSERLVIGVGLEEALREMAERNDLAEYRFFATALSLQHQTGGGLAETLENLADVIRKRVALRARGYALASEARTSAAVLIALPVFAGVVLWLMNPAYIDKLFITPEGRKVFGAAVGSLVLGLLVMRGILQRSLA